MCPLVEKLETKEGNSKLAFTVSFFSLPVSMHSAGVVFRSVESCTPLSSPRRNITISVVCLEVQLQRSNCMVFECSAIFLQRRSYVRSELLPPPCQLTAGLLEESERVYD